MPPMTIMTRESQPLMHFYSGLPMQFYSGVDTSLDQGQEPERPAAIPVLEEEWG